MAHKNEVAGEKLLPLEIIRFLCALLIVVYHYGMFDSTWNGQITPNLPLQPFLSLVYNHGRYAVSIFWCLSGYIFFRKYQKSICNGLMKGYPFFILRFSRLYPLHVITLTFVVILQYIKIHNEGRVVEFSMQWISAFVAQILMVNQWFGVEPSAFNLPAWSVCTEVLVYLLFFLILRFVSTSVLLSILIAGIGVMGVQYQYDETIHKGIGCLACFYYGGLTWFMEISSEKKQTSSYTYRFISIVYFSIPLTLTFLRIIEQTEYISIKVTTNALLIPWFAVALLIINRVRIPQRLDNIVSIAGNLTYASYLCHFPILVGTLAIYEALNITIPVTSTWFLFCYVGVTFLAAYFIYYYFERPAQDALRNTFLPKKADQDRHSTRSINLI